MKSLANAPLLLMTWKEFIGEVRSDQILDTRLEVLARSRGLFREHGSLAGMPDDRRKRVAGCVTDAPAGLDWTVFGSTGGAGYFSQAINRQPRAISKALDAVPMDGAVTASQYEAFREGFREALPKGAGIATGTRLLAMRRPDYFVGLSRKNSVRLRAALGLPRAISLENYWSSVCERIQDSAWWNAPAPTAPSEKEIWMGRAALLDSIYREAEKE